MNYGFPFHHRRQALSDGPSFHVYVHVKLKVRDVYVHATLMVKDAYVHNYITEGKNASVHVTLMVNYISVMCH